VHTDKLISTSAGSMIKIWDLNSGAELHTLTGHQEEITDILLYKEKLILASDNSTIKILDFGSPYREIAGNKFHGLPSG
jgi:WD40 repeat protein